MRGNAQRVRRLIEADMPVLPDAQNLYIHLTDRCKDLLIAAARLIRVGRSTVRHEGAGQIHVHMTEQILVHEVAVALVVLR